MKRMRQPSRLPALSARPFHRVAAALAVIGTFGVAAAGGGVAEQQRALPLDRRLVVEHYGAVLVRLSRD